MADFTAVAAQTFPVSKGKICVLEQRHHESYGTAHSGMIGVVLKVKYGVAPIFRLGTNHPLECRGFVLLNNNVYGKTYVF